MLISILVITIFFVIYAVLHSLLAGFGVKAWARKKFGAGADRWYRLAYNLLAGITLLPIFPMLLFLPDKMLYVIPSPWRWFMEGGQLLAVIGLSLTLRQTGALHFLGLAQLVAAQPAESGALTTSGFYGWVRHPLYFFSLLFMWLMPVMSVNLLVLFVVSTLYFYIGSIYEEKRLLAEFGPVYGRYQQQTPRLIPFLKIPIN